MINYKPGTDQKIEDSLELAQEIESGETSGTLDTNLRLQKSRENKNDILDESSDNRDNN